MFYKKTQNTITAAVPVVLPTGAPSLGPAGQIVWGPGDVQEPAFVANVTFTGDGSTKAGVVNWIDGTQALPFTPSCVLVFLTNGGTDGTGILAVEGSAVSPRVTGITASTATVNWTTAVANTRTSQLLLIAYK